MDGRISGERRKFYNAESSNGSGKKKSLEWDLNEWQWDGHHFLATPLNAGPSDCRNKQLVNVPASNSSSSCSEGEGNDFGAGGKGKGEVEKRRRILAVEDNGLCDGNASLSLKLGGNSYPTVNEEPESNGRKSNGNSNYIRSLCQVEGCEADLSNAKDYHRRHKVCETHAKASWAMVGSVMQRFCQQCSRFHLLQEFDEGKRSCRRRLAGHNRRRRKTNPDTSGGGSSLTDDKTSSYLLISLLKLLTNLHSDNHDKSKDQDLLSHLLGNIANLAGSSDSGNIPGLLQAFQGPHQAGTSAGTPSGLSNGMAGKDSSRRPFCSPSSIMDAQDALKSTVPVAALEMPSSQNIMEASPSEAVQAVPIQCFQPPNGATKGPLCSLQFTLPSESVKARAKLNDIDLNCTYNETDFPGGHEQLASANLGNASLCCPSRTSPPQTSGNSESSSVQSLSSSNDDPQSRTGRIVFKLFGKDPNEFPLVLRAQILDWLSHSPIDMESYIRPGCIVLTVYLHLAESMWEELNHNLCSSLNRLLSAFTDDFWRTGWLYVIVQHRMAFIYNGNIMLDIAPLLLDHPSTSKIVSVTPIAVTLAARVSFTVKVSKPAQSATRLLCAFEGKYLVVDVTKSFGDATDTRRQFEVYQYLNLSCSLPYVNGRGFIEVEDHGLSTDFFPFIVAEEDVCYEVRMLENSINVALSDDIPDKKSEETSARIEAMKFLNEMGWLLQRSHLKAGSQQENSGLDPFSLKRFRWLLTFAMDHEWCAVVKKLLDILFQGIIELGESSLYELALSQDLLRIAVRKKQKSMVQFLLKYKPATAPVDTTTDCFLFKPDMPGPSNITPLHLAATISNAENIVDALLNDPGQRGIKAWENARDSTGFTPEDYARSRGHNSYILLAQKKLDNDAFEKGHVVLNIKPKSSKITGFSLEKSLLNQARKTPCKLCEQQKLACRSSTSRSLLYRPMLLSMVGIAAVCVCVGLLFKGPPDVTFVCPHPFRWEALGYGIM